jgi:hypothetical protein
MNTLQKKVHRAIDFDNFDPDNFNPDETRSDLYDPDFIDQASNAGGATTRTRVARPGVKLQININIINATASTILTELFSAMDSWTTRLKPALVVGAYSMVPALSLEGIAALIAAPTGGHVVGFNQAGDLEVRGAAGDPKLTIGCGEYPYISLFESTKTYPFYNSYIRYTVSTDAQIDKTIMHFKKTFGGGVNENLISPRAYFKPEQQQPKTIDIIAGFTIDGESGLSIPVLAGENLRLALFIGRWGQNNL